MSYRLSLQIIMQRFRSKVRAFFIRRRANECANGAFGCFWVPSALQTDAELRYLMICLYATCFFVFGSCIHRESKYTFQVKQTPMCLAAIFCFSCLCLDPFSLSLSICRLSLPVIRLLSHLVELHLLYRSFSLSLLLNSLRLGYLYSLHFFFHVMVSICSFSWIQVGHNSTVFNHQVCARKWTSSISYSHSNCYRWK